MSYLIDYINRKFGPIELEAELLRLIGQYNEVRDTYLLVYTASIDKQIPLISLMQSDFYTIRDLLSDCLHKSERVDIYLETPGGSGETAEEIVRFLHQHFKNVAFVISGEAKSAGTIMALSGHEILMTETGSLGPIDAQVRIGRSVISACDYIEWVEEKRSEAEREDRLNPFDATMVAQITPGELGQAFHAREFAKDCVMEWLAKYKFAQWNKTESRKLPVTKDMKEKRAREVAEQLTTRSKWRTHGRSIKIGDLESIGLKIKHIEEDPVLAESIYRIQTVCRLLFENTTAFKIFATKDQKIFRHAALMERPITVPQKGQPDVVELVQDCPKCGEKYKIYGKFIENPAIDADYQKKGLIPFPKDGKIKCNCGYEMDLLAIKNHIEIQAGRKLSLDKGINEAQQEKS
ncbi:MAG: peptidase [Planctomycetes bacterium RBG_16_55_9]|nr:MAG: peptidase [Planctomycetes bacterium RBG_16_55_9]